jgi:hypothetical protein
MVFVAEEPHPPPLNPGPPENATEPPVRAVTMDDPPVLIALIAPFALLFALCIAGDGDAESESSSERISLRWSSPPAKRDVAASRADATIFSADASTAATKEGEAVRDPGGDGDGDGDATPIRR